MFQGAKGTGTSKVVPFSNFLTDIIHNVVQDYDNFEVHCISVIFKLQKPIFDKRKIVIKVNLSLSY